MKNWRRALTLITTLGILATFGAEAAALPVVGDARPDLTLIDAWDRTFSVGASVGKPVLVVYEDKDSSAQNKPLKDELSKLAKGDKYKRSILLVAVADVAGYAYWPVKGFVKDAIQDETYKAGTIIYCDWTGGVRTKIGLRKGMSSVVLYGRDGKVLLSHEGPMPRDKRARLIQLLQAEVGE